MSMPLQFVSTGCTIRGKFFPTTGTPPFPTVLLLPGFPGNEEDVLDLGRRLSAQGINALMFNYQGTYQSEGTYSLQNTLEDIGAAIAYLHQDDVIRQFKIDTGRLVLAGHSYGGGMALAYAVGHPQIDRIVSIAGTDHGEFAREYLRNAAFAEMIDTTFAELQHPAGPVHFDGREVIATLTREPDPYDLRLGAPALADRDILLIGAWDDPYVTIEHHMLPFYRALAAAGALGVRIVAFQDGHGFEESRGELAHTIAGWILAA